MAYLAGGCVRDELLGRDAPQDYDVATDARPPQVRRIFRRTRPVGEHFGVVLVTLGDQTIEVAAFRTEWGYSDHRHPDNVQYSDAEHDARRRDFTINGLFFDPIADRVIDFVSGRDDLERGIIRAIGDPSHRLQEDHLRALRAVRFAARFCFTIDNRTSRAIRDHARELQGVSRERIGDEVRKMLAHPHRHLAATKLQNLNLDVPVLLEPNCQSATGVLERLPDTADAVTALAAWALDRQTDLDGLVGRWRKALVLSNTETGALRSILVQVPTISDRWACLSVAARKRIAASGTFASVRTLIAARDRDMGTRLDQDVSKLTASPVGLAPDPLLTGDHLIAMGLTPDPTFKRILDAVYDAQLEEEITTVDEARSLAAELGELADD